MARRKTRTSSKRLAPPVRSIEKHNLDHFRRFCASLKLPNGLGPFILENYELAFLSDYFGDAAKGIRPVSENLWILPTGQRKSMLLGALALHCATYVRDNAKVFILGGLGGHGRNALDAAAGFIERDPKRLGRWWVAQEYGLGRIKGLIRGNKCEILVASAGRRKGGRAGASVEGEGPDLILVEELHRHEDDGGALGTLQSKAQKKSHSGWIVPTAIVTTAGDSMDSALGQKIESATDEEAGAIVQTDLRPGEYYRRAIDADGDLVMHEWAVPDEIQPPTRARKNREDLERFRRELLAYLHHVKRANPASFITIDNLRLSYKRLAKQPWVFLRQHANQWVVQDFPALDRVGWFAGYRKELKIPNGAKGVVIGLDLSDTADKIGITPAWRNENGEPVTAGAVILRPDKEHPGESLAEAIDVIKDMLKVWPGAVVAFDRHYGGGFLAQQLEDEHKIRTAEIGMGTPFELASMLLAQVVVEQKLLHDGTVTRHALAATAKRSRYVQDRWRLFQPSDGRPIDGAAALAMALWIVFNPLPAEREPLPVSEYRIEGL